MPADALKSTSGFVAEENRRPQPVPSPDPDPATAKAPDNIVPFVAKENSAAQPDSSQPLGSGNIYEGGQLTPQKSQPSIAAQVASLKETEQPRSLEQKISDPLNVAASDPAKANELVATTQPPPTPPPKATQAGYVAPENASGFVAQENKQPPPPPEADYIQDAHASRDLSAKYGNDPNAIMEAGTRGEIPDKDATIKAITYAQNLPFEQSGWKNLLDNINKGKDTVGGWLAGASDLAQHHLFDIPEAAQSTVLAIAEATHPSTSRQQYLSDALFKGLISPQEYNATMNDIRAQKNPPLLDAEKTMMAQEPIEKEKAQRELMAGVEEGTAQNIQRAEHFANFVLGLSHIPGIQQITNPVGSLIHAFGGPDPNIIDPKTQSFLSGNGIPLRSAEHVNDMDPAQLQTEYDARLMQNNLTKERTAGYTGPIGQTLLDAFKGDKARTPEQLQDLGYPVDSKRIQDIGSTTDLALSLPEFGALKGIADASGATSLLKVASGNLLKAAGAPADFLANKILSNPELAGDAADASSLAQSALVNRAVTGAIKHAIGSTIPFGRTLLGMGKVLTKPIEIGLGLAAKGIGWVPKALKFFAEPVADALTTAGEDNINGTSLLATRTPLVNLMGKTAQNVALGVTETAPLAIASSDKPEEQGQFMMYGALGEAGAHIFPNISDVARNAIGDRLFIRDPDITRKPQVKPDPVTYDTSPYLNAEHELAMNEVNPQTKQPLMNAAKKQTVDDARAAAKGMAELYVLRPDAYGREIDRMAKTGILQDPDVNSRGVAVDPDPQTNQARVFVRSTDFNDAFEHEMAHPIVNRMTPIERDAIFNAYSRFSDPEAFTLNYTKGRSSFSDLPSSDAAARSGAESYMPGLEGLTRDDMKREMIAEAVSGLFKGDSINNFTRNPTLRRQAQMALGGILERFGIDPTTDVSKSILGVKNTLGNAIVLDSIVRDVFNRNKTNYLAQPDLGKPGLPKGTGPTPRQPRHQAGPEPEVPKPTTPTASTEPLSTPTQSAPPPVSEVAKPPSMEPSKESPVGPAPVKPLDETIVKGLMKQGFNRSEAEDFARKSAAQGSPSETGKPKPVVQTPQDIAKAALVKFQGWTQAEADKHVPSDAKTGLEAIQRAHASRNAEQSAAAKPATPSAGVTPVIAPSAQGPQAPQVTYAPTVGAQIAPTIPAAPQQVTAQAPAAAPAQAPGTVPAPEPQQPKEPETAPPATAPSTSKTAPKATRAPARETTVQSAPLQKHMRREGTPAGTSQRAVHEGPPPKGHPVTTGSDTGTIGAFGYVGDSTPDTNSLLGKGAFPHSAKAGSMIDGYSAALTDAGAAKRGVRPGQEFVLHGKTYRYDDRVPDSYHGRKISDDYVDVYSPNHAPDAGVSAAEIARQQAIASQRPGYSGQPGAGRGDMSGPPSPGEGIVSKSLSPKAERPLPQAPSKPEPKPEAKAATGLEGAPKAQITRQDIDAALAAAEQNVPRGTKPEASNDAVMSAAVKEIGKKHAETLPEGDTRVQLHPDTGAIAGTGFVACYSYDTEILTRRGWITFPYLSRSDEVATRNCFTKEFQWQLPSAYINTPYSGSMIHFHSKALDILVTPEHRMLLIRDKCLTNTDVEWVLPANTVANTYSGNGNIKIPITSHWAGVPIQARIFSLEPLDIRTNRNNTSGCKGVSWNPKKNQWVARIQVHGKRKYIGCYKNIMDATLARCEAEADYQEDERRSRTTIISGDDFCALAGAYIAEGNIRSVRGLGLGIQISQQSTSKAFKIFKELMERIQGFSGYTGHAFYIRRRALSDYFSQFGHAYEKFIPEEIMNSTPDQIRRFLYFYTLGDGSFRGIDARELIRTKRTKGVHRTLNGYTVSKKLADQLCELWQKVGYSASVSVREGRPRRFPGKADFSKCRTQYVVTVRFSHRTSFTADSINYSGTIHCVTVPNGIVYVRRNGKPAWCGNSDPFHQWLLNNANMDANQRDILAQLQEAIRDRKPVFADYGSAPEKAPGGKGLPTAEERSQAQAQSAAKERAKGLADIQQAGKAISPSYVGVEIGKKGEPNSLYWGGISSDKLASNSQMLTDLLGRYSPYKGGPLKDNVAEEDLHGVLHNWSAGWKGDGSARLAPVEGSDIPKEPPGFEPYHLAIDPAKAKLKSDFWNLSLSGRGTKLAKGRTEPGGKPNASGRAQALAEANQGVVTPEGHVNPLAAAIDQENPGWLEKNLHSSFERLRLDLTNALHPSEETLPTKIHPGHPAVSKAIQEKGYPPKDIVKAGFMPGKEIVSPNIKEGTDFDFARNALFSDRHHEAKDYARRLEDAVSGAYGYKKGQVRDALGDWGDGAENSIITETKDTPFQVLRTKVALKGLHSAQKQGIAFEDHPSGEHAFYTLKFNKTPAEVRDIMQAHALAYKTILADTKHGEPTEAYVLDTDGSAGNGIASLAAADRKETGLASDPDLTHGHGEFLGDPEGNSRDVAASNFRSVIKEGFSQAQPESGARNRDIRDLGAEARASYDRLKEGSGMTHWMPGELKSPEERQKMWDSAAKIMGVTHDLNEAGYVLPDGRLLDFSGRHDNTGTRGDKPQYKQNPDLTWSPLTPNKPDPLAGQKRISHYAVQYEGSPPRGVSTDGAMNQFIRNGAVRISAEGAIETGPEPLTVSQKSHLKDLISVANEGGEVYVDVTDQNGANIFGTIYEGAKPSKILGDIARAQRSHDMSMGAAFMPGDVVEGPNGQRERIKAAAVRFKDSGNVHEGLYHNDAFYNGVHHGETRPDGEEGYDVGYTTTGGRFIGRDEAWNIAKENKQLRKGASQRSTTTGEMRGLASEDVKGIGYDVPKTSGPSPGMSPEASPSKTSWMPGDIIKNAEGQQERIKSPAIRLRTGEIFTGIHHGQAYDRAEWEGKLHPDDKWMEEEGYVTDKGRFVNRDQGWDLAKESKQLAPGAQRIEDQLWESQQGLTDAQKQKLRDRAVEQGATGLDSFSLNKPGFMPGDVVENAKGERERIKSAAVRFADGTIHEGPSHSLAISSAVRDRNNNIIPEILDAYRNGVTQDGYTTTSGRFLNRRDAWKLAYKSNQLSGGGPAGSLNSEYIKAPSQKPAYMPMAGERAAGYQKAKEEGRTFMSPYDQKPRFEISDRDMKWKHPASAPPEEQEQPGWESVGGGKETTGDYGPEMEPHDAYKLGDLIEHPALFKAYPDLKNINVEYNPRMDGAAFQARDMQDKRATGLIQIGDPSRKDLLIHEIQHAIQHQENWPGRGASLNAAASRINASDLRQEAIREYDNKFGEPTGEQLRQNVQDLYPGMSSEDVEREVNNRQMFNANMKRMYVDRRVKERQFQEYQANAGEIEAREAQRRVDMTPEQREKLPPYDINSNYYVPSERAWFMPSKNALPVEWKDTESGERVPAKIPFELSKAPILADKQPDKLGKDAPNKFGEDQFNYLTDSEKRRLTALDNYSATGTLAKKAASQLRKWLDDPEIAAGKDWYESMRNKLADAFGEDHEIFSHLLGVTSPREDPHANFLYALEAYDRYKAGDFDRHIDLYKQAHTLRQSGDLTSHVEGLTGQTPTSEARSMSEFIRHHDILPRRDNGLLYGTHGVGILKALSKTWADEPTGPKTKNYAGNLLGTTNAATIDSWAARFIRRLGYGGEPQWRIQPASETGVRNFDFAFGQLVFDKAAKAVGMQPDAAQAICWFGEKDLWEKRGWTTGMGARKSSLDTPFDVAYPQGPTGPRLPYAEVRKRITALAKEEPALEPDESYAEAPF